MLWYYVFYMSSIISTNKANMDFLPLPTNVKNMCHTISSQ